MMLLRDRRIKKSAFQFSSLFFCHLSATFLNLTKLSFNGIKFKQVFYRLFHLIRHVQSKFKTGWLQFVYLNLVRANPQTIKEFELD